MIRATYHFSLTITGIVSSHKPNKSVYLCLCSVTNNLFLLEIYKF